MTGGYGYPPIKKVEIQKETEKSVWINGKRISKRTKWLKYWSSFDEAKEHLIAVEQIAIKRLKSQLNQRENNLSNYKNLTDDNI
jgi:hypothetical protein